MTTFDKLSSLEKKARIKAGRAKCTDCPIGMKNCNMQLLKLCTYSFVKGYKSAYRDKYKKK